MPSFRRDLIRQANRERLNSTEIESLLEFSEYMVTVAEERQDPAGVYTLIEMWKDSFDEP